MLVCLFSTQESRVGIKDRDQRQLILNFARVSKKMTSAEVTTLKNSVDPYLRDLVLWVVREYGLLDEDDACLPPGIEAFLRCIASPSPVCNYLPPSPDNIKLIRQLTSVDFQALPDLRKRLLDSMPIFSNLLCELDSKYLRLPKCFHVLLERLITAAEEPFVNPDHHQPDLPPPTDAKKLEW